MTWEIQAIARVKEKREKGFHIQLKYEVLNPCLGESNLLGYQLLFFLSI